MADLVALKAELDSDPLGRGYAGMTDAQAASSLNDVLDRVPPGNPTFDASEVFQRIDQTEFNALSNADEAKVWNVLHLGLLNPWGREADILTDAFGAGSTTITDLKAWRNGKRVSRGRELGFGIVREGYVSAARAL